MIDDKSSEGLSNTPLVSTEVKEVEAGSGAASKSFAIVIGIILAVLLTMCFVGYLVYRRYKRRQEEKEPPIRKDMQEKGKLSDFITNPGSSPLKNGDVTSFDEEANDDQFHFHPSQMFSSPDKDFRSVRK